MMQDILCIADKVIKNINSDPFMISVGSLVLYKGSAYRLVEMFPGGMCTISNDNGTQKVRALELSSCIMQLALAC